MPYSTIDGSGSADGTSSNILDCMVADAGIAGSTLASRASRNAVPGALYRL